MKITAQVTRNPGKFELSNDIVLDDPQEDEVLVKVVASGVCHTDAVALEQQAGNSLPQILGHEGCGIVEAVGSKVTDLKKGDHVVMAYPFCGSCVRCRNGLPGSCERGIELSFGGHMLDGTTRLHDADGTDIGNLFGQSSFATYSVCNRRNTVKVDPDVDLSVLAPLGCGISTGAATVINGMRPKPGDSVAVFGTGAVGMAGLMAAKICGCGPIVAVDVVESRLELARELGATHVINSKNEDPIEAIMAATDGKGADFSMDTAGIPEVILQATRCLARGGTLEFPAVARGPVEFDMNADIMFPSRTIRGIVQGEAVSEFMIPKLVAFYKAGLFPVDKLIEYYDFDNIEQAFADSASGAVIKPVIKIA